jgi:hypothetical protein
MMITMTGNMEVMRNLVILSKFEKTLLYQPWKEMMKEVNLRSSKPKSKVLDGARILMSIGWGF